MKRYRNLSGTSGVTFYEDGPDFIKVQFGELEGIIYVYDYVVPGAADVEQLKALALAGRGLSTYISQRVGNRFRRTEARPR